MFLIRRLKASSNTCMSIRAYSAVWLTAAREAEEGVWVSVASALMCFVQYGLLLSIYRVVYASSEVSTKLPFSSLVWSLAVFQIVWGIGTRWVWQDIQKQVRSGMVEMLINKPISYLGQIIVRRLGRSGSTSLFLVSIVTVATAWAFAGAPLIEWSPYSVGLFVLLFVAGNLLSALLSAIVGLSSFFLQDAQPIFWFVDKMQMVFSGSFVPLALLPPAIRAAAEWSPFGLAMVAGQVFYPPGIMQVERIVASVSVWIAVSLVIIAVMWNIVRRRLAVNGG